MLCIIKIRRLHDPYLIVHKVKNALVIAGNIKYKNKTSYKHNDVDM